MNVTKETLLHIIKKEMKNLHEGLDDEYPTMSGPVLGKVTMDDGEMKYQQSDQELIDLAREEISTIDAYRGVQRGDFDYHHVAGALRKLADEYQEAADRQGQEV